MIRVVLDTNLVISGMLWSGSPRDVLRAISAKIAEAVTSEALIDELRDVLQRGKFEKYLSRIRKTPEQLVTEYLSYTVVIEPAFVPETAVRDAKDIKVLAAAVGGQAKIIVSGDDDLLSLKTYSTIEILNPRTFLARIQSDEN